MTNHDTMKHIYEISGARILVMSRACAPAVAVVSLEASVVNGLAHSPG